MTFRLISNVLPACAVSLIVDKARSCSGDRRLDVNGHGGSMELVGFIVIVLWSSMNALIASKRGRSGGAIFAASIVPVLPLIILASLGSQGSGTVMAITAFLPPLGGFLAAIAMPTGAEAAARTGAYGDLVRCPFCAESVRKLAVRCRHCGSDLKPSAKAELAAATTASPTAAE
ncbi:hypothetical protein Q5H91_07735 [Sphingomonas sp. KR1UV-12]|uniref:Zinc ribbon domain-containing protein n=1 Tax=Sphingomonas aurea TaxID=3063994 RepID=A0ABT9EJF9_9SPHN|nr:hypothetical protein [Sphingomonas sp. KR1UV-12]MDP1027099.1 hypothetical protein [Sphingomonas sp. KR1UV-12]